MKTMTLAQIAAMYPNLISFDLYKELQYLAQGYALWWSAFAPKVEITNECLRAGLIEWCADHRNVCITDAGRKALEAAK